MLQGPKRHQWGMNQRSVFLFKMSKSHIFGLLKIALLPPFCVHMKKICGIEKLNECIDPTMQHKISLKLKRDFCIRLTYIFISSSAHKTVALMNCTINFLKSGKVKRAIVKRVSFSFIRNLGLFLTLYWGLNIAFNTQTEWRKNEV